MEKFPKAAYTPETAASNDQFELQAKERNAHRSWLDKLIGNNAVSGMDMLKDEAAHVNELVDQRMRQENVDGEPGMGVQDAADEIMESKEFAVGKSARIHAASEQGVPANEIDVSARKRIAFKELVHARHPALELQIEAVNLQNISRMVEEAVGGLVNQELGFKNAVGDLIQEQVDTRIKANDMLGLQSILELNSQDELAAWIPANQLAEIPHVLLTSPLYAQKVRYVLERSEADLDVPAVEVLRELQRGE